MHIDKKDLVDQFGDSLRESYKTTRFVSSESTEWPPDQPKAVVNVVKMSYTGSQTYQELLEIVKQHKITKPGVDELVSPTVHFTPTTKNTKNISDIFSADPTCRTSKPPQRILIKGAPGIGKTVLVKEAAYKWAAGELLTDKKLLIVLFLRNHYIQSITSLPELLKELTQHEDEMFTAVNDFVNKNDGKGVAFLIDGFDEYPVELRSKSFIYKLIHGKILQKSTVAVTSRSNTTSNLFKVFRKRVEILGFAEEQRSDYIKSSLKETTRKILEEYLELNPLINSLCYVPLQLAFLLYLFKQNCVPETFTKINELFVLHTVYHHLKRDIPGAMTKIKNLPEFIHSIIVKLSKMAYIGLKQNKLVFTYEEVEKLCPEIIRVKEAANGYGLLQAIQYRPYKKGAVGLSTSFNFLHSTMQEFLAAYYVSTLSAEPQLKMLEDFWEDHLSYMWMMYVGLTGTQRLSVFSQFVETQQQQASYDSTENRKKGLHLFQCLLEANKTEVISHDMIPGLFTNEHIDLQGLTLLPYNVLSVTSFIAKSPRKWKYLNLENCHMGDIGMRTLQHFFHSSHYKEKTSAIEGINLFGNDLASLHGSYCSIIKNGQFRKFSMSKQKLHDNFAIKILGALATNINIKSFDLSENIFGIDSAEAIRAFLETNSTLEELDISNNCVGGDGAKIISSALCNNTVLKHFNIKHNNIRDEGAEAFSIYLAHNSTLKELNLSWNSISSKGISQIALSLTALHHTKLSAEGSDYSISSHLQVDSKANTTLEVLNLSHNTIGNDGVKSLSLMLQNNSSLKTLNISYSELSDDEVTIIVDSVKGNTTLCNLDMAGNKIASAAKIVELLQCNKHLSRLNLQQHDHWNFSAFNLDILSSIMHSNHSLKWLGLPRSSEEWQLNKVKAAINQSRSSMNISHIVVEHK